MKNPNHKNEAPHYYYDGEPRWIPQEVSKDIGGIIHGGKMNEIESLRRIDGILDKRIRYIERRVWLMFGLAFVLIGLLFCALITLTILGG